MHVGLRLATLARSPHPAPLSAGPSPRLKRLFLPGGRATLRRFQERRWLAVARWLITRHMWGSRCSGKLPRGGFRATRPGQPCSGQQPGEKSAPIGGDACQAARDPPCGPIKCPHKFPHRAVAAMEDIPPKNGTSEAEIRSQQNNMIPLAIILVADIKPLSLGLRGTKVIHHGFMGEYHFMAIGADAHACGRRWPQPSFMHSKNITLESPSDLRRDGRI